MEESMKLGQELGLGEQLLQFIEKRQAEAFQRDYHLSTKGISPQVTITDNRVIDLSGSPQETLTDNRVIDYSSHLKRQSPTIIVIDLSSHLKRQSPRIV
ncbi:hypothetical protein RRG08_022885 [Elysia crispata]|uniref:Uncharacterized protein n=1 Tax=Elysia crispata TaxID=231223 RepID=A0AAE1ACX1_9GAST|nr:hypothetical protein RRG08_022885 [Elysia crispata]